MCRTPPESLRRRARKKASTFATTPGGFRRYVDRDALPVSIPKPTRNGADPCGTEWDGASRLELDASGLQAPGMENGERGMEKENRASRDIASFS